MKLLKFRVTDFRSVVDSGWVDCQNVTAFAGENESGKTTLLMALLKLMDLKRQLDSVSALKINSFNLAKINIMKDMPIDRAAELQSGINDVKFIYAQFEISRELEIALKAINKRFNEKTGSLIISKTYGGTYDIDILDQFDKRERPAVINCVVSKIPKFMYYKEVTEIDSHIDLSALAVKLAGLEKSGGRVKPLTMRETMVSNLLNCLDIWESNLIKSIAEVAEGDTAAGKRKKNIDFCEIFERLPLFRARVQKGFERLNREFLKWWGKDDVTIGFEPYNKGVVIKIIGNDGTSYLLENRSTGFRRFFALFLSFSIAAKEDYENTILLFDEAGAALHPLTQKKLANFFSELGRHCQLIYNTHTSYMLSIDQLNRVRVVYKDKSGHTQLSSAMRINEDRTNEMSLFPVQSALALYVAEKAMAACLPVIVLNNRDEDYLSIIKNILTAEGRLNTVYTILIFAAGENGIDAAAETFAAGDDLPLIFLPSDVSGRAVKKRLTAGKYSSCPQKVLEVSDFMKDGRDFEDLIPSVFTEIFSKLYIEKLLGKGFVYEKKDKKLIEQIESYSREHQIKLPDNYRSEISRRMKVNTMKNYADVNIPSSYISTWTKIWKQLLTL